MARIVRTETRKRGILGKLAKWGFILFNVLMLVWLLSYWGSLGGMLNEQSSEASRAGTAVGGTIGTGVLVFFWLAGAVILGIMALLTRGKTVIVEETLE